MRGIRANAVPEIKSPVVGVTSPVCVSDDPNLAATGQPEEQLRAAFELLLSELAELCDLSKAVVSAVGESAVGDLKTRPDYAVTVHNTLVGSVELKAPGKGADPRSFKDPHDKAQSEKLRSLPNLIYTDGKAFFENFLRWELIPRAMPRTWPISGVAIDSAIRGVRMSRSFE